MALFWFQCERNILARLLCKSRRLPYLLKETELKEGIAICRNKVLRLLGDAEVLAANQDGLLSSLALYIFAVEEYGKLLLLKKCLYAPAVRGQYPIPRSVFRGASAHKRKFKAAKAHLPPLCTYLLRSIRVPANIAQESATIQYPGREKGKQATVSVPAGATGLFTVGTISEGTEKVQLAERSRILYVDWDDGKRKWVDNWYYQGRLRYESAPDSIAIRTVISEFRKHLLSNQDI